MKHRLFCMLVLFICCTAGQVQTAAKLLVVKPLNSPHVVGELLLPNEPKSSMAVVVLGGSSGRINRVYSERLAAAGITALSLAYFGAKGLPDSLDNVPVETVSKAIDYLNTQLTREFTSFGVLGVSRGSELAFLAAAIDLRIKAVVGIVPSSVSWHGQMSSHAWTIEGKTMPSLSFERQSTLPIYQRAVSALASHDADAAMLPFEKIQARILLISATADHIWPSTLMAERIIDHLKEHNYQYSVKHIQLDDNHFIDTENMDVIEPRLIEHFKH